MKGVSSKNFSVFNHDKVLTSEYSLIIADHNWAEMPKIRCMTNPKTKRIEQIRTMLITSERTGATTIWHFSNRINDNNGEFFYDEFIPSNKTLKDFPHLKGYILMIYND